MTRSAVRHIAVPISCLLVLILSGCTPPQPAPQAAPDAPVGRFVTTTSGCGVLLPMGLMPAPIPATWSGACVEQVARGLGTLVAPVQGGVFIYTGTLISGRPSGQGRAVFADGKTYDGGWKDGQLDGPGTIGFPNGDRLSGTFRANLPVGMSTFTSAAGDVGTSELDLSGLRVQPDGSIALGSTIAMKGVVTVRSPNGASYEGTVGARGPEGMGTMRLADGSRYVGQWVAGKRNGQGVAEFANGARIEGNWRDDKPEGQAVRTNKDGSRYDGQWRDGKRDGRGTLTMADGSRIVATWRDDLPDGEGTLTEPNGNALSGIWRSGCLRIGSRLIALRPDTAACP